MLPSENVQYLSVPSPIKTKHLAEHCPTNMFVSGVVKTVSRLQTTWQIHALSLLSWSLFTFNAMLSKQSKSDTSLTTLRSCFLLNLAKIYTITLKTFQPTWKRINKILLTYDKHPYCFFLFHFIFVVYFMLQPVSPPLPSPPSPWQRSQTLPHINIEHVFLVCVYIYLHNKSTRLVTVIMDTHWQ